MSYTYIAIGSNLCNPIVNVKNAIIEINGIPKSKIIKISSFYETLPYGYLNQPNYINAVILLKTELSPIILLNHIQNIEKKNGRKRYKNMKWGPRTLDLDILLFDNLKIKNNRLIIPHYDIENRSFFIIPLIEITPKISLPNGIILKTKIKSLNLNNIKKITILCK